MLTHLAHRYRAEDEVLAVTCAVTPGVIAASDSGISLAAAFATQAVAKDFASRQQLANAAPVNAGIARFRAGKAAGAVATSRVVEAELYTELEASAPALPDIACTRSPQLARSACFLVARTSRTCRLHRAGMRNGVTRPRIAIARQFSRRGVDCIVHPLPSGIVTAGHFAEA